MTALSDLVVAAGEARSAQQLRRFLRLEAVGHDRPSTPRRQPELDLVTVAFNNVRVLEHQLRLIGKYLGDDYTHAVADNSPLPGVRQAIRELCAESGAEYISLPANPFAKDPSRSHGAALTWVYENHLRHRDGACIGFLDHDIFPTCPTSVLDHLRGNGIYGLVQERGERWYLWPGFAFFEREILPERFSLMPVRGLDTGGAAWSALYSRLVRTSVPPLRIRRESLRPGNDPHGDEVEYLGDWLHTHNASYWKDVANKDGLVDELLWRL